MQLSVEPRSPLGKAVRHEHKGIPLVFLPGSQPVYSVGKTRSTSYVLLVDSRGQPVYRSDYPVFKLVFRGLLVNNWAYTGRNRPTLTSIYLLVDLYTG